MPETEKKIPLGRFVFERVRQIGVKDIFGVPGDYNLKLLDHIYDVPDMRWVGNCNELNAAYCADGFARASKLPGVLVTTYGVGELSALNGISGSFAETVPVVHIVGTTPRYFQRDHTVAHHAPPPKGLLPPDHTLFEHSAAPYSCAHEILSNLSVAAAQIDKVLVESYKRSKPATLFIPIDMVNLEVPASLLDTPLDFSWPVSPYIPRIVDEIYEGLKASKSPIIIADMGAERWSLGPLLNKLAALTGAWEFSTVLGKSAIDETEPRFVGVYAGIVSLKGIPEFVEKSDWVLHVGERLSDANTGAFSWGIKPENSYVVNSDYAKVKGVAYDDVFFGYVLKDLIAKIEKEGFTPRTEPKPKVERPVEPLDAPLNQRMLDGLVTQATQPHDTLIVEIGAFQYESQVVQLPKDAKFFTQIFYSSIGFSLPAAVGAAFGRQYDPKNKEGRVVLVEGDGSCQMTVQEIALIVRYNLPITIILINNNGYAIERMIWGEKAGYNDICPDWKYTKLFDVFGAKPGQVDTYTAKTGTEFADILSNKEFKASKKPQMVEIFLPTYNYSDFLIRYYSRMKEINTKLAAAFNQNHPSLN